MKRSGLFLLISLFLLIKPIFSQTEVGPILTSITPAAASSNGTISLYGKNFGNHINQLTVSFFANNNNDPSILQTDAVYLSGNSANKQQFVRIFIPERLDSKLHQKIHADRNFFSHYLDILFGKTYYIQLQIAGQSTQKMKMILLDNNWRVAAFAMTLTLLTMFALFFYIIFRKHSFWRLLIKDKTTNRYSLAKLQAFLWTITIISSYLYILISWMMIFRGEKIPEINPSLFALMAISYGGLAGSKIGQKKFSQKKPSIRDLISDGEAIDLTKFQLFCFTILAIFIYLLNLYQSNLIMGLPGLPTTLYGLLLTGQVGYMGGQFLAPKLSIKDVQPNILYSDEPRATLTINGDQFKDAARYLIHIERLAKTFQTRRVSNNTLKCNIDVPSQPGVYDLILLVSKGQDIIIPTAIEVQHRSLAHIEESPVPVQEIKTPAEIQVKIEEPAISEPDIKMPLYFDLSQLRTLTGWGGDCNQAISYKQTSNPQGLAKILNDIIEKIKDTPDNGMDGESYLKRKPLHMYTVNDYWCATISQFLAIGATIEREKPTIVLQPEQYDIKAYAVWRFNHFSNWQDCPWNSGIANYYPPIEGCSIKEVFTTDRDEMRKILCDEQFFTKVFNIRRNDNGHSFNLAYDTGNWHRIDPMDGISDGSALDRNKQILNLEKLCFQNHWEDGSYRDNRIGIKCLSYYIIDKA